MHVAGGLYRELCDFPPWDAWFGSGGRAAAAVVGLSPGTVLHTYAADPRGPGPMALRARGVDVWAEPGEAIVFTYFHALSTPLLTPRREEISRRALLQVSGGAVLRFGFLEGDASVKADRAVYDPQTHRDARPFRENGSSAHELALVLNELEACAMGGASSADEAASAILSAQGAAVVVLKRGPHGATVHHADGRTAFVPAFRSSRVFKIGTGDVFSALFCLHWGERGAAPEDAAEAASRAVSAYCEDGILPSPPGAGAGARLAGGTPRGPVLLVAQTDTPSRHWLAAEVAHCLKELGVEVTLPTPPVRAVGIPGVAAVLMLEECLDSNMPHLATGVLPTIILSGPHSRKPRAGGPAVAVTDDLTTAVYLAAWATSALPP